MIQLKRFVERAIKDNWDTTKIHYYGSPFDSKGLEEWIMVKFSPINSTVDDSNSIFHTVSGLVEIYCYADDIRRAMSFAEVATSIMRSQTNFHADSSVVYDQGTFQNETWFVNARINVKRLLGELEVPTLDTLVDEFGVFLTDSNNNILTA